MTKTKEPKSAKTSAAAPHVQDPAKSWREAVESIVIAIVLAFLFRAFEAEAFVIPTGSMAPTLQGRHKDLTCPQCGFRYQTGASLEAEVQAGPVQAAMCPACRFVLRLDPESSSHVSHTGDRILVNKFAYEPPFGDPQRWDVIVFKYPGNAKQNYIKRCVGLENETIKIHHGDIYVQKTQADGSPADADFHIARKPPHKIKHLLQLVHDTDYRSTDLHRAGWPLNWQPAVGSSGWTSPDLGSSYVCSATDETEWLHFRQYYLAFDEEDRHQFLTKVGSEPSRLQELDATEVPVTDFYAYNAQSQQRRTRRGNEFVDMSPIGKHWVGDLGVEAEVEVKRFDEGGQLELVLIEAGRRHAAQIDLASGRLTLRINDGEVPFVGDDGQAMSEVTAETSIRGAGRYRVRFTNLDDQLLVWIDDELCQFDGATSYRPPGRNRPQASLDEPGDLHPVRLGARNAEVTASRLRVLRDVYYIATQVGRIPDSDYSPIDGDERIYHHLLHPTAWKDGDLFDRRETVTFAMNANQFFALGDNSPYSKDGRLWEDGHYVERDMLIGKAVLIYWPHAWRIPIPGTDISVPLIPNFQGIGLIH